ncbi:MAG: endonuclease [Paludibacteraceae bacterium]
MKRISWFSALLIVAATLCAQPSETYYSSANGKSDDELRKALMAIIDGHTVISYDNLEEYYPSIDARIDNPDRVWDIYSTCEFSFSDANCSQKNVCDCWNKEHTVPQSWFGEASPMKSDLYHVLPTDARVNNFRGNLPYGEVSDHSSPVCGDSHALGWRSNNVAFEPVDEFKGDIARIYFYMATRYADKCSSWSGGMFGSGNNGFVSSVATMLLKWHRNDPVSEKETLRNDAVFACQKNRNPFVDYPCLAEYIWGDRKGTTLDLSKILSTYSQDYAETLDLSGCTCALTDPTIIAPQSASTFEVGSANINETISKSLTVKGVLLTKNLSLTISGTDAALFSVNPANITSATALAGTAVTVSYKPTSLGSHTATLTIGSAETEAVVVTLTGKCEAALVSPTTDGLLFVADNVADKYSQTVELKGTNLSSNVSLSISGTHAAMFAVSVTSATAGEVNAGKFVTVSYQPTALGTHTATLVVSSADFATVNVPLTGSCSFSALDATNVTKNSFTANWTNAGVSNYTLDVFTQQVTGVTEVTLLEDACDQKTTATTGGGVYYDIEDCVRLGSGSKVGSLTYNNLDLSKGGSVVVNAQYYNTDAGTQMKITAGSVSQTFTLTSSFADYVLSVEAAAENTSVSVVIESLESGKRVNVNNVKVLGGGETITNTSLDGYPKQVGNVQSYTVVGLEPNTDYYYNVTPDGVGVSEDIAVTTLKADVATAIDYNSVNGLVYYTTDQMLYVINLHPGVSLVVYDTVGRIVEQRTAEGDTETFVLPSELYLVRVQTDGGQRTLKIAL